MLEKKLTEYGSSDSYAFHMPGHKRQELEFPNPYLIDITEIEGFDNLHHPQGILKEAQERAAVLYGSQNCYFLVNGSTCGILAALSAAAQKGDKILVARNCHKAVYHGIYLRELHPVYVYPVITGFGLQGQIRLLDIKKSFEESPDIKVVILTSPTYDGIVSDIKIIADYVHKKGAVLIVDEAHGAHLGFSEDFPENAVSLGADAVIMSIHKTLPAFTQTALLHLCSSRISKERVEQFLNIYETSSPSYILMAGMDKCISLLEREKESLFGQYSSKLKKFYSRTKELKNLHILKKEDLSKEEAYDVDPSKIVILSGDESLTGSGLQERLRTKFRLELEMAAGNYSLAMTSIMDTDKGFDLLAEALEEIDNQIPGENLQDFNFFQDNIYKRNEVKMNLWEAWDAPKKEMLLKEAKGAISGAFVSLYPPGIPLITPGEVISEKLISDLIICLNRGLTVEGLIEQKRINIVNPF